MKPKAYSYIRFSSPEQAKGDSYRRQREAAEAYCKANDLEFVDSKEYLFFDKGRSAYKGKHLDDSGELARFLRYVQDGSIAQGSYLLVESLDRLSREEVKDALPRFLDLLNARIKVATISDGRCYDEKYNELDLIISIVQMSRAHNESALKAERVSKAWRNKQEKARKTKTPLGAACPYWLELKDGKYVPIPDRVNVVKRVFALSQNGYGQRAITKLLNDGGVPVFGSGARNSKGTWSSSSIYKLLNNRALLGEYQPTNLIDKVRRPAGEPIKDFFPTIITEAEWYSAHSARNQRLVYKATKPASVFNIWQGIIRCAECGEALHLVSKGKPPKGGRYLRCYGNAKGVCKAGAVRLDASEMVFKELLTKVDSLALVRDSSGTLYQQLSILDGQLVEVNQRIEELKEQVLALGSKLPASLVSVMVELEEQQAKLKGQKALVQAELQRDKIIDKEEFLKKVDLVSHDGRFKANRLLKHLRVLVLVKTTPKVHDFWVCTSEASGLVFMLRYDRKNNGVIFTPITQEQAALGRAQGDDMHKRFREKQREKLREMNIEVAIHPDAVADIEAAFKKGVDEGIQAGLSWVVRDLPILRNVKKLVKDNR